MVEEQVLQIQWARQDNDILCGPAVIQMFLSHFQVDVTQSQLWIDVQDQSDGSGQGPTTFPKQVCFNCGSVANPDWQCWNTTPEALANVVELHAPQWVRLAAAYASDFPSGLERLIDSFDRTPQVPPFATVTSLNHWVLLDGYRRGDLASTEMPPVQAGKHFVNGVYILDPQELDEIERVRLVAASSQDDQVSWQELFGLITCGEQIDTHPVVVGRSGRPLWWVWMVVAIAMIIWWFARYII